MAATRHEEVERKFAVEPDTECPSFSDIAAVAEVARAVEIDLEALYFDTVEGELLRPAAAGRRGRRGLAREGPSGPGTRTETRLPLGRAVRTVPKRLRVLVEPVIGSRPLVPVARVTTHRTERALRDASGADIALFCDDVVRTERLVPPTLHRHWREWEIELTDGNRDLLETLTAAVVAAGARPAPASSKVARALAEDAPERGDEPPSTPPRRRSDASEVLRAYLAEQLVVLREHDAGLQGEKVHQLRIAARRLRSVLASYQEHVDPGIVEPVREELRWLGLSLGPARDFEVLRRHLDEMLDGELGQPNDTASASLRSRIDHDLEQAHRAGRHAALEAVASERYGRLVTSLEAIVESPTALPPSTRRARSALPGILARDVRRVRRAAEVVTRSAPGHAHDAALHEVRKKAKRLRYSAESAIPVLGTPAKTLVTQAKALQEALGAHQDAVAARAWLQDLAARADGDVTVAFGAGRLHAGEQLRARSAERDYEEALRQLPRKHVRTWLRGRTT
ncbi:CYTH and CHAD domain-containing protein [Knoellia aerolata]|nr:CYTH and CHAD domain-containing protein [Knoellia aerolata]